MLDRPTAGAFALAALLAAPLAAAKAPQAVFDPDLLAGMRARSIGPAAMSGRVTAIEGVESDPQTVYVGAASGGVWKSTNGAHTFSPVFDDQPVHSIGAIAVFQRNPDVVWVGTGEGNLRNSASVGNGVYRSLDAGKTWTHLGLDATEHIARIVLHPTDPDVAWVAALGREWGENSERGVFKTSDGGRSWKKVLYVDEKTGAGDLAIDPANPQKLFAGMWQFRRWPWAFKSGGPGSGLFVTYDGGATWKRKTEEDGMPKGLLGRSKIAFSRSAPEIVYAAVEAADSALLRSEDGGRSWKTVNHSPNVDTRPFYFAELKVDPQWPNRIYNLGFDVKVSDDSGKSFQTLPADANIHGDYHAMWIDPRDPRHFLVGDDGGVAVSRDRGQTEAFVANLPLAQYYHVTVDMETPFNIYGGLQDNGSWRGPSSVWELGGIYNASWTFVGGGDGFATAADPEDATQGYSMSQSGYVSRWNLKTGEIKDVRPGAPDGVKLRFNWNSGFALDPFDAGTIYYGSQFLHRSTDRGRTWTIVSPDLTTDNPAWQKQSQSGGLTLDASGAENYTTILAISPSPVARGVIWVGTDDGRVQLTRDGGKSWTSVEANVRGVPAHTWVPEIRASRFDAASAFVVFDDHRRSNPTPYVYETSDYGKTWRSLATADLRGYALAIEQDPADRNLLFLGTEFGLWVSTDAGGHWFRWKHGLPTASVMGLAVHPRDRDLVIATHGRALYVLDDIRPLESFQASALHEPLHLFPVPDAVQHWQRLSVGGYSQGAAEFRGENRPYGALITFSVSGADLPLPDAEKERARKEREHVAAMQAAEAASAAAEAEGGPPAKGAKGAEKPAAKETKKPEEGGPSEPKAEIDVADSAGKVIRRFHAAVKLGVNRVAWPLVRDDFREPPPGPDQPPQEDPAGPEVPPGSYTVIVKFRGQEAKGTVRVLPDPRSPNAEADWRERWAAIERAGALQDATVAAIDRIGRTRADVDAAVAKVRQTMEDERRAKGEPAPEKPASTPTTEAADKLKKQLDALEKRLWPGADPKGIQPPDDVLTKIGYVAGALTSSWEPPSPTQREYLRQAGGELDRFLADFNQLYASDVAAFRKQLAAARIELLPEEAPIAVAKPGS
ncbi:MAG TPA: hypothetical protein VIH93_00805 [Thermoanaerobaculia bacterium]|jgi:hypothetical protein